MKAMSSDAPLPMMSLAGSTCKNLGQVLLAQPQLAGRIRLDEKRQVLGQILEHGGRRVLGIGDVAEVDDALGFLVSHHLHERRGVGRLVEKMTFESQIHDPAPVCGPPRTRVESYNNPRSGFAE